MDSDNVKGKHEARNSESLYQRKVKNNKKTLNLKLGTVVISLISLMGKNVLMIISY